MKSARLDEAQAGIRIARRNTNNLRYADDTTLMEESKEKLKSLLMKEKEESEKGGLKLNIQKKKIMWNSNTLATRCEEPTHWKRPWYWKRLKAGEGGDRGWDGWIASPTQWTWV